MRPISDRGGRTPAGYCNGLRGNRTPAHAIGFDPPDPDVVWEHNLEKCRRAGIEPVSREQAEKLITEWSEAIAAGLSVPPKH